MDPLIVEGVSNHALGSLVVQALHRDICNLHVASLHRGKVNRHHDILQHKLHIVRPKRVHLFERSDALETALYKKLHFIFLVIITHYKRMGYVIIAKPNVSSIEGINRLCHRGDVLHFRHRPLSRKRPCNRE